MNDMQDIGIRIMAVGFFVLSVVGIFKLMVFMDKKLGVNPLLFVPSLLISIGFLVYVVGSKK